MKAERRHELQHNVLADQLALWIERGRTYSQAIIASTIGVIVLIGVYFYFANRSAARETAAWSRYLTASDLMTLRRGSLQPLIEVADQYPATRGGKWARLAAAELQFEQGVNQSFENRTQSNDFLTSAEQNFNLVLADTSDRTMQARALMGLARTHEAQNRLDQARLEYDGMITRYPDDPYVDEARQRRADLDKASTKSFYDWFAKQEPKAPADDATIPGHKPKFDMNALPPEGPIFEPLGRQSSKKSTTTTETTPAAEPATNEKESTPQESSSNTPATEDSSVKESSSKETTGKDTPPAPE